MAVGRPLPGDRHDSRGWEESGVKAAVGVTTMITDGGHDGAGPAIPRRKAKGRAGLPDWKETRSRSEQVRARVETTSRPRHFQGR